MNDLCGKKLLILAGAGIHNKVVRAAKEMGIYTIVTDYLEDSPAKKIADESWMYSITDVDAIVERCKKEHIDGVINFCIDPGQIPYQQICERLELPCIATKEQYEVFTNKRRFKTFLTSHDVDVIPEFSEDDIISDNVEYPLFIKPADSRGSRGQTVCFSKAEALSALAFAKAESRSGEIICEKYMKGYQDIGSAFFVVDGEPYLVKFGDRILGREEDNLQKQVICTSLPSQFSEIYAEQVMPRVKDMIKALGIKFGPVFLQGFVDGQTVRYYDPGLRMPGGDYDLILKKATGFDTVKSFIHFALTGDTKTCFGNPNDAYLLDGGHAFLFTITVRAGLIAKILGFDEISQDPHIIYARQIIEQGTVIHDTGDISQRVAAFGAFFKHDEVDEVNASIQKLYSVYRVFDENGEDMVVSKYCVEN